MFLNREANYFVKAPMKSDEANESMPVEDERPKGHQPPFFFCESEDQVGVENVSEKLNSAVSEGRLRCF